VVSAVAVVFGGCGPAAGGYGGAAGGAKPTVRVGSANFAEAVVLGELYGQVLESNGYKLERKLNLGSREIYAPALESGQIDLVPEYLATYLTFLTKDQTKASTDPAATQRNLQAELTKRNLAVLDYAPAVDTNGVVVTKATADRLKLAKVSDLAAATGQLVLGGPPECPAREFCLLGLQKVYGLQFKDFKPLDVGGPLTVAALEGNQIDVGILFTTDAAIKAKGFVLLQDDKKLQLADNVAPVVRNDLVSKAPADFKTLLNGVSAKLTTEELTELNRKVGIDKQDPKAAAAAWLKTKGLVR
jgi:osmoprotectant transport system substrate-binding protein